MPMIWIVFVESSSSTYAENSTLEWAPLYEFQWIESPPQFPRHWAAVS